MSFLGEIKRRKVFQVAAVYAVVAWLIIQIIDVVSEPLNLPDRLDTVVIVLLLAGFPIAVILAWAFDITPQGIKSASDVQAGSAPGQPAGQRFSYISQALVLCAVGFLVLDQYIHDDEPPTVAQVTSGQADQPIVRLAMVHPGAEVLVGNTSDANVALSRDGRHIVYLAGDNGGSVMPLYVRALDQLEPVLLSSAARSPFFSPDGQWVGFVENNKQLSKVALTGGPSVRIGELAHSLRGASWGSDDSIVFGTSNSSTGLFRISAAGGDAEILTTPDTEGGEFDHSFPEFLPGARAVLFTITSTKDISHAQIALLDLETLEYRILISGGSHAHYSESGHIVYGAAGSLRAVPFDLEHLKVTGSAIPVLDSVRTSPTGSASFGLASDGTLVYLSGGGLLQRSNSLVWVHREGGEEPLTLAPGSYSWPRLSPDGTQLAVTISRDVWVHDLARGSLSRATSSPALDNVPLWTPDGEHLVFASSREGTGTFSFFQKRADGTGPAEKILTNEAPGQFKPYGWSPDGKRMVFDYGSAPAFNIGVLTMGIDEAWEPLLQSETNESAPSLSPDGKWIAYSSDQTGQCEVYIQRFPDLGDRRPISTNGGAEALWSPDGHELFYREGTKMMSVSIDYEPRFSVGIPELLFDGLDEADCSGRNYDISVDGQRFLVIKTVDSTEASIDMIVVLNWFQELRRLAPVSE